jgi:hypothetical protein
MLRARIMHQRTLSLIALMLCSGMVLAGCARQPSTKRSASVIRSYFHSYGKKYSATVFGHNDVKEVQITDIQEIHKGMVAVQSFVTLKDGTVQRIYATLEKGPFGWKFLSWENAMGGQ